jgi:hypothetical protein
MEEVCIYLVLVVRGGSHTVPEKRRPSVCGQRVGLSSQLLRPVVQLLHPVAQLLRPLAHGSAHIYAQLNWP